MNEIKFLIHNLLQDMPLYDRQQPQRVVDMVVEKWSRQRYVHFIYAQTIILPDSPQKPYNRKN